MIKFPEICPEAVAESFLIRHSGLPIFPNLQFKRIIIPRDLQSWHVVIFLSLEEQESLIRICKEKMINFRLFFDPQESPQRTIAIVISAFDLQKLTSKN